MIYPISIKPVPRIVSGEHKGAPITHIGITDQGFDIYTKDIVIRGSLDLLPYVVRRSMASLLHADRKTFGPHMKLPEEVAEDDTYDPDALTSILNKPEPSEVDQQPKEKKLEEQLGLKDPVKDEPPIERQKAQTFPENLPSKHPKEIALEKDLEESIDARIRQALPVHTGPLTKKFMAEITDELKKDDGTNWRDALNTSRYLKVLTFTRKPEAQSAAKAASSKGFPGANVIKIFITKPDGQKKEVYVISNTSQSGAVWGALILTKEGYKKLMATQPKKASFVKASKVSTDKSLTFKSHVDLKFGG